LKRKLEVRCLVSKSWIKKWDNRTFLLHQEEKTEGERKEVFSMPGKTRQAFRK